MKKEGLRKMEKSKMMIEGKSTRRFCHVDSFYLFNGNGKSFLFIFSIIHNVSLIIISRITFKYIEKDVSYVFHVRLRVETRLLN